MVVFTVTESQAGALQRWCDELDPVCVALELGTHLGKSSLRNDFSASTMRREAPQMEVT